MSEANGTRCIYGGGAIVKDTRHTRSNNYARCPISGDTQCLGSNERLAAPIHAATCGHEVARHSYRNLWASQADVEYSRTRAMCPLRALI